MVDCAPQKPLVRFSDSKVLGWLRTILETIRSRSRTVDCSCPVHFADRIRWSADVTFPIDEDRQFQATRSARESDGRRRRRGRRRSPGWAGVVERFPMDRCLRLVRRFAGMSSTLHCATSCGSGIFLPMVGSLRAGQRGGVVGVCLRGVAVGQAWRQCRDAASFSPLGLAS